MICLRQKKKKESPLHGPPVRLENEPHHWATSVTHTPLMNETLALSHISKSTSCSKKSAISQSAVRNSSVWTSPPALMDGNRWVMIRQRPKFLIFSWAASGHAPLSPRPTDVSTAIMGEAGGCAQMTTGVWGNQVTRCQLTYSHLWCGFNLWSCEAVESSVFDTRFSREYDRTCVWRMCPSFGLSVVKSFLFRQHGCLQSEVQSQVFKCMVGGLTYCTSVPSVHHNKGYKNIRKPMLQFYPRKPHGCQGRDLNQQPFCVNGFSFNH